MNSRRIGLIVALAIGVGLLVGCGGSKADPPIATGIIYEDTNGNGMREEGEPGLGGVRVVGVSDNQAGLMQEAVTNEFGVYRLELTLGGYDISVDETTLPAGYTLSSDPGNYKLNVAVGRVAEGNDFGFQP